MAIDAGRGTWLIVGGDSEIGGSLLKRLAAAGRAALGTTRRRDQVGPGRVWLDLSELDEDWAPPLHTTAACLCAARSRLADCAADPAGSWNVNVDQTAMLVARLSELGIYTLLLSTNQVFDGTVPRVPPDAPVRPVSEYGRQKAAVEARVLGLATSGGAGTGILRLSRVLSTTTATTARWASSLARGEPVTAFYDMVLAPVPIGLVAEAVQHLMADTAGGIFQLSGPEDVSYAEFARALAASFGHAPELVHEESAAAAADLPTGSCPRHTTLDSSELQRRYGLTVPKYSETADQLARAIPPIGQMASSGGGTASAWACSMAEAALPKGTPAASA
ncbi:MAG TPA: sugar nucleotide-binding protein [Acidimicrobiales bacterium]|nr:sugar nucleotide-binding protein [Acidimicrobiales bacterium]